jgi:hypothetical protein
LDETQSRSAGKGSDGIKARPVALGGVDVEGRCLEPNRIEWLGNAEMAAVIVRSSARLLASPLLCPGSRNRWCYLAAHNPQRGERQQWLESACPVRMLKSGLRNMGHAIRQKQTNRSEEEVVGPYCQRVGWSRNEAWRCRSHAFLDLVTAEGGAADF